MARSGTTIAERVWNQREAILQIARAHNVRDIRVFGSVARGDASAASDVDFLVTFEPDYTLWDHIGLMQALSELLGRPVDVSTEDTLLEGIRAHVLAEAIPL